MPVKFTEKRMSFFSEKLSDKNISDKMQSNKHIFVFLYV